MASVNDERPILFSAPMIKAILDGRKTQTRRVIRNQPIASNGRNKFGFTNYLDDEGANQYWTNKGFWHAKSKYGKPGDRLWVKETYCKHAGLITYKADDDWIAEYRNSLGFNIADNPKWKPSIFMPRDASRILLEITNIRVERLQDISEADALAEGVNICAPYTGIDCEGNAVESDFISLAPSDYYRELWESINGNGSWDLNPWVWVIEFKRI